MTPERYAKILRVLRLRQPTLSVMMDQVNKPHNLSAILRTCDAVGAATAHAIPPSSMSLGSFRSRMFEASSGSAHKWIDVQEHPSAVEAIRSLQAQGVQVLATHLSARSTDYTTPDYTKPTCVLLGAEKFGVSDEAADAADANIVVPMMGMVQSLNVSVAAATILFEAQRQRLAAGMYEKPQLSEEELARMAFRWSYPDMAAEFDKEGKPYPAQDEHGAII